MTPAQGDIQNYKSLEGILGLFGGNDGGSPGPDQFVALGALRTWVATHPDDTRAEAELTRINKMVFESAKQEVPA